MQKSVSYGYERDGLLSSRTVDGQATSYEHLRNGAEKKTTPWGSSGEFVSETNSNGTLRKMTLPNGAALEQLFDPANRLVSRIVKKSDGLTILSSWKGIAYDEDDNRVSENVYQAQPQGEVPSFQEGQASYSYDPSGRLTSHTHPFDKTTDSYTLDDAGNVLKDRETAYTYQNNRLTRRVGTFVTEKNVDGVDVTVTTAEDSFYSYDRFGNQVREDTARTITGSTEGYTETSTVNLTTTHSYNAASQTKRVSSSDGSWVEYSYDGLDRMVSRQSSEGEVTLFFSDGPSEQIALETDGAGTAKTRYILDSSGEPLGKEDYGNSTGRSYYIDDPRGNLTQMIDHSQNVVGVFAYDPFGKEKPAFTKRSGNWDSRLRFQMAPTTWVRGCSTPGSTASWEPTSTWRPPPTWSFSSIP